MKRFVKRIKILNYIYRLCLVDPPEFMGVEHHLGECDPPDTPNKEIRICTSAKDMEELDTLIHEMLHALAYHQFSEEFVCQSATHIAKVLWDWGYRKIPEQGIVWKQDQEKKESEPTPEPEPPKEPE